MWFVPVSMSTVGFVGEGLPTRGCSGTWGWTAESVLVRQLPVGGGVGAQTVFPTDVVCACAYAVCCGCRNAWPQGGC